MAGPIFLVRNHCLTEKQMKMMRILLVSALLVCLVGLAWLGNHGGSTVHHDGLLSSTTSNTRNHVGFVEKAVRLPLRVSSLRYQQFYKVDSKTTKTPTRRKHKATSASRTRAKTNNDEEEMRREEANFWNRALQDESSMSLSMNNRIGATYPYINRFNQLEHENRDGNWRYNIRDHNVQKETYTCACNDRYGNWIEFRNSIPENRKLVKTETKSNQVEEERKKREEINRNDKVQQEKKTVHKEKKELDFVIAGFPKCGTTTLLHAFGNHSETSIHGTEHCAIAAKSYSDQLAYVKLNQVLNQLEDGQRGIKCPTALKTFRSLQRLQHHSPQAKLLVGVRHPVRFLESFYNYRVTEIYNNNKSTTIPPIEDLVGSNEWLGVSTDNAQFEMFLMQLGKSSMSFSDMELLAARPTLAVKPFPFQVFFYSLEQLEDLDKRRAASFRQEMQDFLQLDEPLPPFGRENQNYFVGDNSHPETIDICNDRYADIRDLLTHQARQTQAWMKQKFLPSADVYVGGEEYFLQLLNTWSVDPCTTDEIREE